MLAFLQLLGTFVANLFKSRRRLEVENCFLRHQLNIALKGAPRRLGLRGSDRALMAQQIVEAFPWGTAPTYLVRDNDGAYGQAFKSRIRAMGIGDRPISPRSPWQYRYAERLIGTLRRECLDQVLILWRTAFATGPVFVFALLQ